MPRSAQKDFIVRQQEIDNTDFEYEKRNEFNKRKVKKSVLIHIFLDTFSLNLVGVKSRKGKEEM